MRLSLESTTRWSLRLGQPGGSIGTPLRQGVFGPAGVGEHGIDTSGSPRNLGRPVLSMMHCRQGNRLIKPWPVGYARGTGRSEIPTHIVVSPSEAQRSAVRGGQGIGALHS